MKLTSVLVATGLAMVGIAGVSGAATAAPLATKAVADASHQPVTQVRYSQFYSGAVEGRRGSLHSLRFYSPHHTRKFRGIHERRNSFRDRGHNGTQQYRGPNRSGISQH